MTSFTLHHRQTDSRSTLEPSTALRWSWVIWGTLLLIPFAFLLYLLWTMSTGEPRRIDPNQELWFSGAMAYLVAVLPSCFFWRGHLFKEYWQGRPVSPAKYILATVTVGLALAAGGIFALVGCVATNAFMPNLIPAGLSLLLFVLHWPTGRAMVKPVGHVEDPEIYQEPS
jgi:hypothetical protein